MSKFGFIFVLLLSLSLFSGTEAPNIEQYDEINIELNSEFQENLKKEEKRSYINNFLNRIGHMESSNRYHIRKGNYYGRYQFGCVALIDIDMHDMEKNKFLSSPQIQDEAMIRYLFKNKFYLQRYIDKYVGTTHDGIFITEAGILASAHLGGSSSVKVWFDTGRTFRDGNGTPITKYMKEFEDMNYLNFENEEKIIDLIL